MCKRIFLAACMLLFIQPVFAALQYEIYDDFNGSSLDLNKWIPDVANQSGFQITNGVLKIDNKMDFCNQWNADQWSSGGCVSRILLKNLTVPFGIKAKFSLSQLETNLNIAGSQTGIGGQLIDQSGNKWNFSLHLVSPKDNAISFHFYQENSTRTPSTSPHTWVKPTNPFDSMELTFGIDQINGKLSFTANYNGVPIVENIDAQIDTELGADFRNKQFTVNIFGIGTQFWTDKSVTSTVLADLQTSRAVMNIDKVELGKSSNTCLYTLNPTSANHSANAENGSFNLTVTNGCNWNASSNQSWVRISNPSGSGNATIFYSVDANPNATTRSAIISVNGQSFTINQAAKTISLIPDIRIEPTTLNF
jgi:hypothetical protein